ncbi:sensor histidine kinase [Brevundimonas bullata]
MHRDIFRTAAWRGHALAILAWMIAFALRYALAHWFPPGFPYLTFFPAVVFVAYYAGLRPAILAATLSGLSAWWFWIGPIGFDLGVATLVALGFYIFVVSIDIFFIVGMDGASRRLAQEVERSTALAASRDILLREVQHRVSNNIQVVSALLSIEARGTADPGARRALADASSRTALIARIQRHLADAEQQTTAFNAIASGIADDALRAAARDDVSVTISGEGVILSAEEATPVVLIMLECLNNALEHAFPDRAGRITISLSDEGAVRTLCVADDGIGVSIAAGPAPESLGLKIVHGLARQLGGGWSLSPTEKGAVATLQWPKPADPH